MTILTTLFDLAQVLLGFTLIIVLHELGHFLAARWAGIRVLAFAVGFGPALVSFRKGLGIRLGSSQKQYDALPAADRKGGIISPTEYRWNILPLGGYVKMLGQDDADPTARSDESDSYQNCPPAKRMVVISAGVVMNVITAAVLFVVVFMAGLRSEAPVIGQIEPGSPASSAIATNAPAGTEPGLRAGDKVVRIDSLDPGSFQDIAVQVAMSAKGTPIRLAVQREGVAEDLTFNMTPRADSQSKLLSIGIGPAADKRLFDVRSKSQREEFERILSSVGAAGVQPGSTLVSVAGSPAKTVYALTDAARTSNGREYSAVFRAPAGAETTISLKPKPELPIQAFKPRVPEDAAQIRVQHVLGLMPVMTVDQAEGAAQKAGLQAGDVFIRLGDVQYPSLVEGISEIRRNAGKSIEITVSRASGSDGRRALVQIGSVPVGRDGRIGFVPGSTLETDSLLAHWPAAQHFQALSADDSPVVLPAGAALSIMPGSRITTCNGSPIASLVQLREAIRSAVAASPAGATVSLKLAVTLPVPDSPSETIVWQLPPAEARAAAALAWTCPLPLDLFERLEIDLRAASPLGALSMGVRQTHRVMLQTYLTFARLFQGSVKVEHLRGPVGIAHAGTLIADRGFIWLLFFMAVISVNLAVVNFLPLPIVDGGHFLFLIYEQVTGKPVSVMVQNIATLAGLALIGSMFLIVTYNDLANLLWR